VQIHDVGGRQGSAPAHAQALRGAARMLIKTLKSLIN
jgi:hypothetical protein